MKDKIYSYFPFQRFEVDELPFVFENGKLHSPNCCNNNYLYIKNNNSKNTNIECLNLKYSSELNKIVKRSFENSLSLNHEYFNFQQAICKLELYINRLNDYKLKCLSKDSRLLAYKNRIDNYERFKLLLASCNVERIQTLIKVCINNGESLNKIIYKINQASNELYKPKSWTQDDIDLAVLVLRIGGPALLYAFNKQNKLPCTSFISKTLNNKVNIEFSYELTYSEIIRRNLINFCSSNKKEFFNLQMDEVAIIERGRWCNLNNEIVGFCYNHKKRVKSFEFVNYFSVKEIEKKFKSNEIHLAKEALCITISKMDRHHNTPKPVIILPVCSHIVTELPDIIREIAKIFYEINPNSKLLNIASDGDHYRRKMFNEMREPSKDPFYSELPYFDTNLILGEFGLNFDVKHLIKRLRGKIINSKDTFLLKRNINRGHIVNFFPNLQRLMDIHDHQNVPYAVDLLAGLINLDYDKTKANELGLDVVKEIGAFGQIVQPLLDIFTNPKINLIDQLAKLAYCSHLMLFIYRKWKGKFMSKQLYMDIQSSIQDAFVAAHTMHHFDPNQNLYLFLLGTDLLENLFSVIRTLSHANNSDFFELIQKLNIANQIEEVLIAHPTWRRNNRLMPNINPTNDYSSTRDWVGELTTAELSDKMLKTVWTHGHDVTLKYALSYLIQ